MINSLYVSFQHWSIQGTIWIISDTHFKDTDLEKGIPGRPSAEELVRRINSKVGRKDTLILLGDVGDVECARVLKGYKVLVMGNHDAGARNYRGIFDEVYKGPVMIFEKIMLSHEPVDVNWVYNIHGHLHQDSKYAPGRLNVCADIIGYYPINFNQFIKSGRLTEIVPLHRRAIDRATARKR